MECLGAEVERFHRAVTDHEACRVVVGVEFTADLEPALRRGRGDQVDDDLVADERFPPPNRGNASQHNLVHGPPASPSPDWIPEL